MDSEKTSPLQTFTEELAAALDSAAASANNEHDEKHLNPGKKETSKEPAMETSESATIKNRGTGAGGARTNETGLSFEAKTSIIPHLLETYGFVLKKDKDIPYYARETPTKNYFFFQKSALKKYCKKRFNAALYREPDECLLIEDKTTDHYILKVIEKKNQNVAGSVDTKLYAGPGFKFEYGSALGTKFTIQYAFTLSTFLMNIYNEPKKEPMRRFNEKEEIPVFHGESPTYYTELFQWLGLELAN
jgi:hypothetical protein